jgi:hypothetical protein
LSRLLVTKRADLLSAYLVTCYSMKSEPSLLDYLKSIVDPRRPRLRLTELAREQETQIPAERSAAAAEREAKPFPASDLPASYDEFTGSVLLPESDGAGMDRLLKEQAPSRDAPDIRPPGPVPWRTLAMLALALFAQLSFETANRSPSPGVILYGLAFAAGIWAYLAGEFRMAMPAPRVYAETPVAIRIPAAWFLVPMVIFTFILMGGNQFKPLNVAVWALAIFTAVWIFWLPAEQAETLVQAFAGWRARLSRPEYRRWLLLLGLAAVVMLFFRFYRLGDVPPQMFSDHAEKLQDVQDVLNGDTRIFFPRNTGREFVQMYLTAFTASVLGFGLTFMALKMGTALAGIFTLPFIYLLGVELGNRRVGLFAMLLAGISYWLNVITRVALRFSLYPMFAAPVLYFVVRGLRRGSRNDFIWAGVFLGFGLHGYSTYRFVPIFVVLAVGLFVLHAGSMRRRAQAFWQLGVAALVAFVIFLPLLRFMTESESNRMSVLYRSMTRIGTFERQYPAPVGEIFLDNLWDAMTMMAWDNGETWVHSVTNRPALDVVSAALFYSGYVVLLVRYIRRRNWEDGFLLFSVPFLMMPSILSLAFPNENPSLNRTGGAIIPVFIVVGLALDGIMRAVRSWGGSKWGRQAAWGLVGLLLLWSAAQNYNLVFVQYSEQFRMASWNTTELGGVIRGFIDSVGEEESAFVIPWPHWVDTRLVGINAGVYIKDYALPRERLVESMAIQGPKLFLFNLLDSETLAELQRLYPNGSLQTYQSEIPGKDFLIYLVSESQLP